MSASGSPRNALWVDSAAARFARRSSTDPQSAPRFAVSEPRKTWNRRPKAVKPTVSFCCEATNQHLTLSDGVILP